MELRKAKTVAADVMREISPGCIRCYVAGSVRREAAEVKDIEFVLLPLKNITGGNDLFGGTALKSYLDPKFVSAVKSLGVITLGKLDTDAGHLKVEHKSLYSKIQLDIFLPRPEDFWRQYAIRTGSWEYVVKTIAGGWRRLGWCAVDGLGLRKVSDCRNVNEGRLDKQSVRMKPKWELVNPNPELPPVWTSEQDFFDWINVKYIHPKFRI